MTARASHGLDYYSAREVTPRWFAVSSGNGNDGVSHTFPDYYCRCTAPEAYDLAAAAMISQFDAGEGAGYKWAAENCEVSGEADYTITAEILNPPEDETEDPDYQEIAEAAGFVVAEFSRFGFRWTNETEELSNHDTTYYKTEAECLRPNSSAGSISRPGANSAGFFVAWKPNHGLY
jgi:hypothetical protein